MKKLLFFTLCAVLFLGAETMAQKSPYPKKKGEGYGKRPDRKSQFLKTQWWLGFIAGSNLTQAISQESYSGYVPVNYDPSDLDKTYDKFLGGGQAGISVTFYHRGFSFVFEPQFRIQQFGYENNYLWTSETDGSNTLELNYHHVHRLQYVDMPLFIRYDLMSGKFRPYVQFGGYYSHLIDAKKTVSSSGTDMASGGTGPFENQEVTFGVNDLFIKSNLGWAAGAGVNYDVWNVRLTLNVVYRSGINVITNAGNRYSENPVTGTGDAMDDITLQSVDVSIGCVFPLRFISSNLKAVE